ncbi:MAG: hypothetical protein JWM04_1018 [Verrucomicrobiales bacterium]|nr:hypothetical protein [Verrucomicrobiales bacterium]
MFRRVFSLPFLAAFAVAGCVALAAPRVFAEPVKAAEGTSRLIRLDPVDSAGGELVSEGAFLRRVSLDVVGLLPTPERLAEFLRDRKPDKRSRYIAELLSNDTAYAEHWLTFWNDLLRNDYGGTGFITDGRKQISGWLYESLVTNKPYDQLARELIDPSEASMGFSEGILWRGSVSASQTKEIQFAQSVGQALLGINLKCASCHDSFVDGWKLKDAYALAAIFSKAPLELHRCDRPTGEFAVPGWLFPELGRIDPAAPQPERLRQLATLMTKPENGLFSRNIVNRLWHQLMGTWLVSAADATKVSEESKPLLDLLSHELEAGNYNLKQVIFLICNSAAYQRAMEARNPGEVAAMKRAVKRLTAEQFLDATWQITGASPTRYDAPLLRGKAADSNAINALSGHWIWRNAESQSALPGESFVARKQIVMKEKTLRVAGVATADDRFVLYLNGEEICSSESIEKIQTFQLDEKLLSGTNTFLMVARNGGTEPNPAGLFFELRIVYADGRVETVASDESWEWTESIPDAQGNFSTAPKEWRAAARVTNSSRWKAKYGKQLAMQLSQASQVNGPMVRASLLKNDRIQLALGRPNRDQIVSARTDTFNTLEAVELTNSAELAKLMTEGAARLRRRFGNSRGGETKLIRWVYSFAFSREPTNFELKASRKLIQEQPGRAGTEDFLWAILMLPEFQYVR